MISVTKKVVIYYYKGTLWSYIITNNNYNKYDYWNLSPYDIDNIQYPYEKEFSFNGDGTVEIIKFLINYCRNS